MLFIYLGNFTLLRSEHSLNAKSPIPVTLFGITTCSTAVFANASYPISVVLSGIFKTLRFLQFSNAWFPILVTPSGIVIVSKPVQFLNRKSATFVVPTSKITSLRLSQSSNAPLKNCPPPV